MLYNIQRAKQVSSHMVQEVMAELSEQRTLDKFYDEGLQHLKTNTGKLLHVEINSTVQH